MKNYEVIKDQKTRATLRFARFFRHFRDTGKAEVRTPCRLGILVG
jgi:hypothetical protein